MCVCLFYFFRRALWSANEDSFILLCRVASNLLYPNHEGQIPHILVRDALHDKLPEGRDKTSRACQHRVNYMMKNPVTQDKVAVLVAEVKQDSRFVAQYKVSYSYILLHSCHSFHRRFRLLGCLQSQFLSLFIIK